MEIVLIVASCAYLTGVLVASQMVEWPFAILILGIGTTLLIRRIIINRNDYLLIISAIILFFAGVINIHGNIKYFESFRQYDGERIEVEGMVVAEEVREQYHEINISLIKINGNPVRGNMMLRNYSEPHNMHYQYGDVINTIATFSYPEPAGYRGDFSYELYYYSKGVVGTASYIPIGTDYLGNKFENKFNVFKLGYKINKKIKINNKLFLPDDEAEILNALMLGDKTKLSHELYDSIKLSGVAHVVAVSGLHVSILMLFFIIMLRKFFSKNYILNTAGILGLIFFYLIVGYTPSVARAVLMSIVALAGCYFNRRSEIFTTVAFSALVIVILRPFAMFDVSFILSFAATLAILFFVVPLNGRTNNYILGTVLLSFFATIGTAYITAYYFNVINFTGIITNIFIIPLSTVALVGGYIAAVMPLFMRMLSFALYVVLWLIKTVVTYSAQIPYLNIQTAIPSFEQMLLYLTALYLVGKGVKRIAKIDKK